MALTLGALILTGIYAPTTQAQQIVDPTAPIQFQPGLAVSGTGTSVINITTPSAGGLSHNMFEQYDVDASGVILNNSSVGGVSIIGGTVSGNTNLSTSGPASVILNEITGSTASSMLGPTEVFGASADVIIANPNGVTCAGCSFINTGSVTLSTGVPTPDYAAGTVSHNVTTGIVSIANGGVSGYNGAAIGDLDLIGRQIELQGAVTSSGTVRLRSGAIDYDPVTDTAIALIGAPAVNGHGITSSTDGTILAATVSVLSHDLDIGVSLAGDIAAFSGDVSIVSAHDLNVSSIAASGRIALQSSGNMSVASGALLTSLSGTTLISGSDLNNQGRIESAAVINAALNGVLTNAGQIVSQTLIDLEAGGYIATHNASQLLANEIEAALGSDGLDNAGLIQGNAALDITFTAPSGSFVNRAGAVIIGPALAFLVPDSFDNSGTIATNGDFVVTATNMTSGSVASINAASAIFNITDNAELAGIVNSLSTVTLNIGGMFNNSATIMANTDIDVTTGGQLSNHGTMASGNSINIMAGGNIIQSAGHGMFTRTLFISAGDGTGAINNAGLFEGINLIHFVAGDLRLTSANPILPAIIASQNLDFDLTGDLVGGRNSRILSFGTTTIDAATANLDFGRLNSSVDGEFVYGDNLVVNLTQGGMTIGRGGVLELEGILSINVFGDVINYGTIATPNDLAIVSTNGSIISGEYSANHAGGGLIFTYGDLLLQAGQDIQNNGSTIEAWGNIFLLAGGDILNRRSQLYWDVTIDRYKPRHETRFWEQLESSPAAIINAGGALIIQAAGLVQNDASELAAAEDIAITATDYENLERARQTRMEWWEYERHGIQISRRWVLKRTEWDATATPSLVYTSGNLVINASNSVSVTGTQLANQMALYGSTVTIGMTDPNQLSPTPSAPGPDIDLLAYLTTPFDFEAPGSPYLHTLLPPSGGYALTPDWILGQVGDNRTDLTFLADPTLEAQMIRRALLSEIGVAYLDPNNASDDAQRQSLYQATVDFLKAHPWVKLGDQLPDDLRAAVDEPMLWYEEREIDGRLVLVPVLLLPQDNLDAYTQLAGGVLQADSIYIEGDHVHNTGYILANDDLTILADTFLNELRVAIDADVVTERGFLTKDWELVTFEALQHGGVLGGADIFIQTDSTFHNLGGTISATDSLTIVSLTGDIINEAQEGHFAVDWDAGAWGGIFGAQDWDIGTEFAPGQLLSGGQTILVAQNGEISNIGSTIAAYEDVTLSAQALIEQDVKSASYIVSDTVSCSFTGCSGAREGETVIQQSIIQSETGDIIIDVSAGDFANRGSQILAGYGDITINADNIYLTAATEEVIEDSFSLSFGATGIAYQASEWNRFQTALTQIAGQNITLNTVGDTVDPETGEIIASGGDIIGEGAIVTASNDLIIQAGGDILFDSHQNELWQETWGFAITVSYPGSNIIQAIESGGSLEDIALAYVNSNPLGAALVNLSQAESGAQVGAAAAQAAVAGFDMLGSVAASNPFGTTGQTAGQVGNPLNNAGSALLDEFNPLSGWSATDAQGNSAVGIGIGFSYNEQETTSTESYTSQLSAGNNLIIVSDANISLLGGTQAIAGVDAYVSAGGDVVLAAGADTYMSEGMSAGVNIQFTGAVPTGFGFNYSENESESVTYTGADLSAGNNVTVIAGDDLTITGGEITGGTVDVVVGDDLTITSVQDTASSESVSVGASISFGAGGLTGLSANYGTSESQSAMTNDGMSGIVGEGETHVTVGDHTSLTGSGIASESGALTFETGSLSVADLEDYVYSESVSVGISLNQGAFQPSDQQAGSAYQSPFIGELTIGYQGTIREGITYTVVGEGQIVIGDDPDNQILATIHRDLEGRQVVTIEDEYGFAPITIPLVNFNQLAFEANRIGNFINALTAPIPADIQAMGPNAELIYRRMIVNGMSEGELAQLAASEEFRRVAAYYESIDAALAANGRISPEEQALLALGETLLYGEASDYPEGSIVVDCLTSDTRCQIGLNELLSRLKEDPDFIADTIKALLAKTDPMLTGELMLSSTSRPPITPPELLALDDAVMAFELMMRCAIEEPEVFAQFMGVSAMPGGRPPQLDEFITVMAQATGHDALAMRNYAVYYVNLVEEKQAPLNELEMFLLARAHLPQLIQPNVLQRVLSPLSIAGMIGVGPWQDENGNVYTAGGGGLIYKDPITGQFVAINLDDPYSLNYPIVQAVELAGYMTGSGIVVGPRSGGGAILGSGAIRQGGTRAAANRIRLVEQDGNAFQYSITAQNGSEITVVTNQAREGNRLILNNLHIDGPGPGTSSFGELRGFARELGRQHGVDQVVIRGFERTTGANPGHVPIEITIRVNE